MRDKDNKKNNKFYILRNSVLVVLFIILCFVMPRILDMMYLVGKEKHISPNTTFTSGEMLTYFGVILSGIITLTVMYLSFKYQRKIFDEEIQNEKIFRKIEKRSLISIDEQSLTGYKLSKYNFKNNPVLCINDSYSYIKKNDVITKFKSNNKDIETYLLDNSKYRYIVITNCGQHPLFSLRIKIEICLHTNDKSNRRINLKQEFDLDTLIGGSSFYILVAGILEEIKFMTEYTIKRGDNIHVYIPLIEINCVTSSGEELVIKKRRKSLEEKEYSTEIISNIDDKIMFSTYENEIEYIGSSVGKYNLQERINTYINDTLLPNYKKNLNKKNKVTKQCTSTYENKDVKRENKKNISNMNKSKYYREWLNTHMIIKRLIFIILICLGSIGIYYVSNKLIKLIPATNDMKENLFWLFSASAQSIATFIAFILTGFTIYIGNINNILKEDDTLEDIIKRQKRDIYVKIVLLSVMAGISLLFNLSMIYLNGLSKLWFNVLFIISFIFTVMTIIVGIGVVIYMINPSLRQNLAKKLAYENKKFDQAGQVLPEIQFYSLFTTLEKDIREYINHNNNIQLITNNSKLLSFKVMIDGLYNGKLINENLYMRLREINKYRNYLFHGHLDKASKSMIKELRLTMNEINKVLK